MRCYDSGMKQRGFTIVELVVVIVVIGILAAITIVSYRGVQQDGMDTKIRSIVKTAGDAISLKESKGGSRPCSVALPMIIGQQAKVALPCRLKPPSVHA